MLWQSMPHIITVAITFLFTLATAFECRLLCHMTSTSRYHHDQHTSRLLAKRQESNSCDLVALIHSHHLLDHKPDNMILKGGKFKVRGVGCLGRPGVALCIGPEKSINKFRSKLQSSMPQKKFGMIEMNVSTASHEKLEQINDFEEVTLGELRSLLATLGHEEKFFSLTGIDPSIASNVKLNESKDGDMPKEKKRKRR